MHLQCVSDRVIRNTRPRVSAVQEHWLRSQDSAVRSEYWETERGYCISYRKELDPYNVHETLCQNIVTVQ